MIYAYIITPLTYSWYRCTCTPIKLENMNIEWAQEAKYLGIYIVNAQKCKCNLNKKKVKYYRAAKAILGKLGKANIW